MEADPCKSVWVRRACSQPPWEGGEEGCLLERPPTQAHQGAALGAECLQASASAHAEGAEAARLGVRAATHAPVEREGVGTLFSP